MTETKFKLKNPTEYHLQQQLFQDSSPPSFISPFMSEFDEFDMKTMDLEESDYSSSVLSNPQSFLLQMHQDFHSNDSHLSTSPLLFNQQPFSAPARTSYLPLNNMDSLQIQQQAINEKRRQRRESHNAVERRRRENINERIQELGTLLPESMLEEITTEVGIKPNKGAILRKSVEHIRMLQDQVADYEHQIYILESQLNKSLL